MHQEEADDANPGRRIARVRRVGNGADQGEVVDELRHAPMPAALDLFRGRLLIMLGLLPVIPFLQGIVTIAADRALLLLVRPLGHG